MEFPLEWKEWNMLPPKEILSELITLYKPGMENASEHDRNGVFHWWLKRNPSEEQLILLVKLAKLDPDQLMAQDVIGYIKNSANFTQRVSVVVGSAI